MKEKRGRECRCQSQIRDEARYYGNFISNHNQLPIMVTSE
jgi:hypothetical protein